MVSSREPVLRLDSAEAQPIQVRRCALSVEPFVQEAYRVVSRYLAICRVGPPVYSVDLTSPLSRPEFEPTT